MILTASALLERNPAASIAEIKHALAGNLCRCTGYAAILRAVQRCGAGGVGSGCNGNGRAGVEAWGAGGVAGSCECGQSAYRGTNVGQSVVRIDAADKATGRAVYTADLQLPNQVHGKILLSPLAHARIRRIDTSAAESLPGVLAVITGRDVPKNTYGVSPARYDEEVLAREKVRHVGDPVAAVAAVDERTAEEALRRIKIEYEELPAVLDALQAVQPGAPLVHDRYARNVNTHVAHEFGDIEAAFAESDHVREEVFTGNLVHQCPMEPQAAIAYWEHDRRLVLYSSTQAPHYVQYMLAHVFEMPLGDIRVIRPCVGGGFGVKAATNPLEVCAAVLEPAAGAAGEDRLQPQRHLSLLPRAAQAAHAVQVGGGRGRAGSWPSRATIHLDGGAYSSFGVATAYYAGSMIPTLYKIPNYRYDGYRVMTNKPACGAMRGHGVPQPRFAFECLLNMVAEDLGIDPIEIRRRNAMTPNTRTVNDLDIGCCELRATIDAVERDSGWKAKYGRLPRGRGHRRGERRVRFRGGLLHLPGSGAGAARRSRSSNRSSRRSRSSRMPTR